MDYKQHKGDLRGRIKDKIHRKLYNKRMRLRVEQPIAATARFVVVFDKSDGIYLYAETRWTNEELSSRWEVISEHANKDEALTALANLREEQLFLNAIKIILENNKMRVKISSDYEKIWITAMRQNNNVQIELSYNGLCHLGEL